MKKLVLFILAGCILLPLGADPTSSQNHPLNPAFLATGNRGILEFGLGANVGAQNSYFNLGMLSDQNPIIDLNLLATEIGPNGFRLLANATVGPHLTLHLGPLGVGGFLSTEVFTFNKIGQDFFQIMAQGINLGTTSGTAENTATAYIKTGLYGSWEMSNWTFAGKLAYTLPLVSAESTASFTYTADASGAISYNAVLNTTAYTIIPLTPGNTFDTTNSGSLISKAISNGGLVVDVGAVYVDPKTKRPLFGGALNNIPLSAIKASRAITYNGGASWSGTNVVANKDIPGYFDPIITKPTINVSESDKLIFIPMSATGFFRFPILGPLEVVPEVEMVLWSPFRLNWGITGEVNFLRVLDFTLGLENKNYMWGTSVGVGVNLWLVEVDFQFKAQGPEPGDIFKTKGLSAGLFVALGI